MKKKLAGFLGILLLCMMTALATLFYQGHVRYEREIRALPLEDAVSAYTDDPDYVRFSDIDEDFVEAVISVEDKRFFRRNGYDFIALFRALYHNFLAGDLIEGGSTISEQIAKNLYLNGYVNGLEEKMAEIYILLALEKTYAKEDLFALYANMNYYGDGHWGIKDAAEGYYGKDCNDLSLGEAAMLAGLPNAPSIYQLSTGYEDAKERQKWVLQTMYNNGYITREQMEAAYLEDVQPVMDSTDIH